MMRDINYLYHGPETGMDHIRRTLLKSWEDVDKLVMNEPVRQEGKRTQHLTSSI